MDFIKIIKWLSRKFQEYYLGIKNGNSPFLIKKKKIVDPPPKKVTKEILDGQSIEGGEYDHIEYYYVNRLLTILKKIKNGLIHFLTFFHRRREIKAQEEKKKNVVKMVLNSWNSS